MIQKLREALRDAREAFLRPVSWRISPEAELELRAMAIPSDLTITHRELMGLPYEVDRTLNGSLVELVTDPPGYKGGQTLGDILERALAARDRKAAEAARDAVERRP